MGRCVVAGSDGRCERPVEAGAPVELCSRHLLDAYDWVTREVGVTDLLPNPCAACGSRVGVRYPSGWLCAVCEWLCEHVPDPAAFWAIYALNCRIKPDPDKPARSSV